MLQTLFGFGGRLSRTGFWEVLISVLLLDVAATVAAVTGLEVSPSGQVMAASTTYELVRWGLLAVAVLSIWARFAAHVKRAHDRGHGAVFLVWLAVPIIGWLWLVYELGFQPGQNFKNRFGPQPLNYHDDAHAGGERLMQAQPVADDGHGREHRGLFNLGRPHRAVPVGPAVLDWTGNASEESAEGYAHRHDDYDPGEALMQASELREPPPPEPEPSPTTASQADQSTADHVFTPALGVAPGPAPASEYDDLSAAMGEVRRGRV
jgi:uncharacterized membrane protein YhaH (DUF805 family)